MEVMLEGWCAVPARQCLVADHVRVLPVFWAAQSISGWHAANADHREYHQRTETYPS
jgi:hypothetical protein